MKYKIVNVITGENVYPVELVEDMIKRGELFRLQMLFNNEFADLKIIPHTQPTEGVFKYLDCSTSHVLPPDMSLLKNPDVIAYPNEYGAWVYVPVAEDMPDWIMEFQEKGFSPSFIEVMKMAQAYGCFWIKFDSDGTIHDNLEDCSAFWAKSHKELSCENMVTIPETERIAC